MGAEHVHFGRGLLQSACMAWERAALLGVVRARARVRECDKLLLRGLDFLPLPLCAQKTLKHLATREGLCSSLWTN